MLIVSPEMRQVPQKSGALGILTYGGWLVGWLVGWLIGWFGSVYGISNFVGYLTPNPFYANSQLYFKQFSLAWVQF